MILTGDCIEIMRTLDANSVDAVCTDPPYGLEFMGKRWDAFKSPGRGARVRKERAAEMTPEGKGHSTSKGPFLAAGVDQYIAGTPFQAWCTEWGREALRVTKPGGYLLAFGGTRTHHRLVCGLEDAGWIIRDELDWIYASGFPKGKANLKPAHEPIVLARKPGPLRPLAIDLCRIGTTREVPASHSKTAPTIGATGIADRRIPSELDPNMGRWPSNLLLSDPELFDTANPYVVGSGAVAASSGEYVRMLNGPKDGAASIPLDGGHMQYADTGGYSRFFLIPKADRKEREPILPAGRAHISQVAVGFNSRTNLHPTVKPLDLMRHLVRLVTPPGGTVLDPFLGSGTTAIAAEMEGFAWIGIEKEPEYVAIAEARLNGVQRGLGLDVPAPTPPKSKPVPYDASPDKWGHVGWWGTAKNDPPEEAA